MYVHKINIQIKSLNILEDQVHLLIFEAKNTFNRLVMYDSSL